MEEDSESTEVVLQPGNNEIPPLSLGEKGYTGLIVLGGQIFEDCQHELRWPEAGKTFNRMAKDGAIAPALELVEMMISRVDWTVKIPEGYEEQLKDKAKFLEQNMHDMDHPWSSFIKQVVSFNRYGFCVNEKVYRYRNKENGSKFNDGLIGLKKLPIRSQDSITGWRWKNDGRELSGVWQQVVLPDDRSLNRGWDFVSTTRTAEKFIPRKKFLLFRNNPIKDSPTGVSSLVGAWQSWKYKQAFMESEALSVAQDSHGFKVLYLPPQYLLSTATEGDKAILKRYQDAINNMHQAKESGLILPLILDEHGNKMFEFDIKSVTGQKAHDINTIINRYNAEILTCLFADFLSLGSNGSGSFSLAETKISVIEMAIESKLNEIKSQLNHDLIPQLFALNGWPTDVTPYFDFASVSKESLDEISKFVQRISAVGMLPKSPEVVNWIMRQASIPYRIDEDMPQEELKGLLGEDTSRSGDGMTAGLPSGTGDASGGSGDSSISNNENTA